MRYITYEKERVKNFTDAVFSIAMTILVLDIDVPEIGSIQRIGFSQVLSNRIPQFIGFFVSFLVIGLFWKAHLRSFRYAKFIDGKLLWINIFLLLFIVLLPFSTAMYVGNFGQTGAFRFYCLNIVAIGIMNVLMNRYIYISDVNEGNMTKILYRWFLLLNINVVFVWSLAILLASAFPNVSRVIFVLIFIFDVFINKYFHKRVQ